MKSHGGKETIDEETFTGRSESFHPLSRNLTKSAVIA
jgi:hypothetical protein